MPRSGRPFRPAPASAGVPDEAIPGSPLMSTPQGEPAVGACSMWRLGAAFLSRTRGSTVAPGLAQPS
eukprot:9036630-Alexandrium_andersonii.AAC.1